MSTPGSEVGREGSRASGYEVTFSQLRQQVVEQLMRAGASVGAVADSAHAEGHAWSGAVARAVAELPPTAVPPHSPAAAVFSDQVVCERWRAQVPVQPGSMYAEYLDLLALSGEQREADVWGQYCRLVESFT